MAKGKRKIQAHKAGSKFKYRYVNNILEDHRSPVYGIAINTFDPRHRDLFATVGHSRVTVYRLLPDGKYEVLQVYEDEDEGELLYVVRWSRDDETGAPLLLVGGEKGIIRAMDVAHECLVASFCGHGKNICDMAVLPQRPHLFLSASEDESIRLWNIRTRACMAIFAGEGGHRNKVLSLDFHPWDGHRFLSAGMDNMIKIWSLKEIWHLIEQSDRPVDATAAAAATVPAEGTAFAKGTTPPAAARQQRKQQQQQAAAAALAATEAGPSTSAAAAAGAVSPSGRGLGVAPPVPNATGPKSTDNVRIVQNPLFSTMQVHTDYVDCVKWFGDLVVSKSVQDALVLWRPLGLAEGPERSADGEQPRSADSAQHDVRHGDGAIPSRTMSIAEFRLQESNKTWYVRFSADPRWSVLACGSAKGRVFVFDPRDLPPPGTSTRVKPKAQLVGPCKTVVRQVAISWDGNSILAANEDGTVQRWDRDAAGGVRSNKARDDDDDDDDDMAVDEDQ